MKQASTERLTLGLIVLLFWVIAAVFWWATLWHVDSFLYAIVKYGADLPTSTLFVGEAVHWGVSFGVAVIFSAVAVYAMFHNYHRALLLSVWLLGTSIVLSLIVMVTMTLPMEKLFGEFVPTWTNTFDLTET